MTLFVWGQIDIYPVSTKLWGQSIAWANQGKDDSNLGVKIVPTRSTDTVRSEPVPRTLRDNGYNNGYNIITERDRPSKLPLQGQVQWPVNINMSQFLCLKLKQPLYIIMMWHFVLSRSPPIAYTMWFLHFCRSKLTTIFETYY